jgi:hypothetical protein
MLPKSRRISWLSPPVVASNTGLFHQPSARLNQLLCKLVRDQLSILGGSTVAGFIGMINSVIAQQRSRPALSSLRYQLKGRNSGPTT